MRHAAIVTSASTVALSILPEWIGWNDEVPLDRWSLLRLPVIFRDPKSFEFPRRADECHFRVHQNAAPDGQAFATGSRRRFLGRRPAPKAGRIATRLQRNAQGNADPNGTAA